MRAAAVFASVTIFDSADEASVEDVEVYEAVMLVRRQMALRVQSNRRGMALATLVNAERLPMRSAAVNPGA